MHVLMKVILINELLRNLAEIDADIFGVVQWSSGVEFSDVKGDLFCALA